MIPDSAYKATQERQNAQRVVRLEARRAEHLSVVDQLEKQIAELQPALQEVNPYTEFAPPRSDRWAGCWRSAGRLLVVDSFCSHTGGIFSVHTSVIIEARARDTHHQSNRSA